VPFDQHSRVAENCEVDSVGHALVRRRRPACQWACHAPVHSLGQTVGGFLTHHGVDGFLANAEDVHGEDVDDAEWTAFLTKWVTMPGLGGWVTTAALRETALRDLPVDGHRPPDPWDGAFILTEQGRIPDVRNLAGRLRGQVGRWHGDYVLRKATDTHDKAPAGTRRPSHDLIPEPPEPYGWA
jgi:hypothetical protein